MTKNKLLATTLAVALTASCVFAAQNNVSATPSGTIQDGPTINSTGKIESGDGSVSIDSKDLQELSDVFTNNAEIMRKMDEAVKTNTDNIGGNEYDNTASYKKGDLCLKDGSLYQCNTDITGEDWTAAHWNQTSLADVSDALNGNITELSTNLTAMVQTKYDDVSGKPMWKDAGADTWNFFNSKSEITLLRTGSGSSVSVDANNIVVVSSGSWEVKGNHGKELRYATVNITVNQGDITQARTVTFNRSCSYAVYGIK